MIKRISIIAAIVAGIILTVVGIIYRERLLRSEQPYVKNNIFWNVVPENQASYLYAPGLTGSEILMGRYCPSFTAATGEKVTWKKGGHVIGQPHTCVQFADANLKKCTLFTLNPITAFFNGIRNDLFPLAARYFGEKYGISVTDNPESDLTVANYMPDISQSSIGQRPDINTLNCTYQKHILQYPDWDVVLYGDSRGAATIFNFIALYKPERVKAAVLEGIFDSVSHCIKHFMYEDKSPEAEQRLHNLLSLVARKYRKNGITPHECVEIITDDIPLLFVTSLEDGLTPAQGAINLYKRLLERGHTNVHLLVLQKSFHPTYMIDDSDDQKIYESVVHAFYKAYDLPYNNHKAEQGQPAFLLTQPTIEQLAEQYPLPACELCY